MPILDFKGKSLVETFHLALPYHQLMPNLAASRSESPSLNDNLIIHGDNLLALKSLLPTFRGKIKCIYIDPPYNTGNEKWVYNDNVNHPMLQEWLHKVVDSEDLTRHDKWLCMMMPRLRLLHDLLREDGVIFISIDDNEVHHLRMLMDQIFGADNFVATVVWQKKYAASNDHTGIAPMHDFIVVYQKSEQWQRNLLERTEQNDLQYRYEDANGVFRPDNYTCNKSADERPNLYYAIINPFTGEAVWPKRTSVWRYSKERHKQNVRDDLVFWGKDNTAQIPAYKRYRHLLKGGGGTVPPTWWPHEVAGHTDEARKEVREIFFESDEILDFVTPKPTRLIQRILQIATNSETNDIVLDSFAGSGTTGQAVLAANADDGGNRRFILIEQEDYADSLTAERIRRVQDGVPNAKDEAVREGYGGSFSFFEVGAPLDELTLLEGHHLPNYLEMARHVYFTATGEQLDLAQVDESRAYIGRSATHDLYLFYAPDVEYLKTHPLTLDWARTLPVPPTRRRMVFASHKYLDREFLAQFWIDFCQLPFAIYQYGG